MKLFGHRHTFRLQKYDYSDQGWYFVTICTNKRELLFDQTIVVGATRGSPFNIIVNNIWKTLPKHHNVDLDVCMIMPNHVHLIIHIHKGGSRPAPTLGTVIGLLKSECTKQIRQLINNPQFIVWQRNYYEHIIRNESELNIIRKYIRDNPKNWVKDQNNI